MTISGPTRLRSALWLCSAMARPASCLCGPAGGAVHVAGYLALVPVTGR
jgi:hypothetical protein